MSSRAGALPVHTGLSYIVTHRHTTMLLCMGSFYVFHPQMISLERALTEIALEGCKFQVNCVDVTV
jgi:hypothetical protein